MKETYFERDDNGIVPKIGGNPKMSSAVDRTPGKIHNIFCYCRDTVENTNYLMSLLEKLRIEIISPVPARRRGMTIYWEEKRIRLKRRKEIKYEIENCTEERR
jgi:hypothetical protein